MEYRCRGPRNRVIRPVAAITVDRQRTQEILVLKVTGQVCRRFPHVEVDPIEVVDEPRNPSMRRCSAVPYDRIHTGAELEQAAVQSLLDRAGGDTGGDEFLSIDDVVHAVSLCEDRPQFRCGETCLWKRHLHPLTAGVRVMLMSTSSHYRATARTMRPCRRPGAVESAASGRGSGISSSDRATVRPAFVHKVERSSRRCNDHVTQALNTHSAQPGTILCTRATTFGAHRLHLGCLTSVRALMTWTRCGATPLLPVPSRPNSPEDGRTPR